MQQKTILDHHQFEITIKRLCFQLIENHHPFNNTVLIGIQPRGVLLCNRIVETLHSLNIENIQSGVLDITFYRDDFRRRDELVKASSTKIDFIVEDRNVILIDDVLFTGRTIRSAMDALLDFGRPRKVELLVLVDRKFSRQLPIEPDYTGMAIDSIASEKVKVQWKENDDIDSVIMLTKDE